MNSAATPVPRHSWKDPVYGQVRVYLWEWPIRFSHWLMVIGIVSLSITGYYMHSPYVTAPGHEAFVMGKMRFVHILSAYAFSLAIAVRMAWFFLGNRWVAINQYLPTTSKRLKEMGRVGRYYGFMSWRPLSFIGHNPLAGLSYLVIYILAVVEILTGFALFSQVVHTRVLDFLIGWLPRLIDIQYLRETHFLIMFAFWMFFIQHVYQAVLISVEEESGLMDSIFSGYKFVPKEELERETREHEAACEATAPLSKPVKAPTIP